MRLEMMEAFEHWFGPNPFYEDGFKLVEALTWGNGTSEFVTLRKGLQNGFIGGTDLSDTRNGEWSRL